MKTFITNMIFYPLVYFIFLFDKDGAQLGLSFFPTTADGWILTASILGNVLWIFGVLFLLIAGMLFYMCVEDEFSEKILREKSPKELKKITKKPNMPLVAIAVFTAMFGVGSGFWFTGLSWLLLLVGAYSWRHVITKAYEKHLEETGEKSESSEDDLKKSLLD